MIKDNLLEHSLSVLNCPYIQLQKWDVKTSGDPYWRLYWNNRRGAFASDSHGERALIPSQFMAIPPETPFRGRLEQPVRHMFLTFLVDLPYDDKRIFTFAVSREARQRLRLLLSNEQGPPLHSLSQTLAAHFLAYLAVSQVPSEAFRRSRIDHRLAKAVSLLRSNLHRLVSNRELAQEAGMNVNSFIRLFSDSLGAPPQAFHSRLRIHQACILLSNTALSIDEIAQQTGFCDRYYFSRVFKRLRGISPAAYRRQRIFDSHPPSPTPS